ncbi:MAG: virulence RhuM family protein [Treponema sp.]|nr:virulence RhuM family protein [Treponema sp.]
MGKKIPKPAAGQFFLYKDSTGRVQINALLRDETLWLTQKAMAELFEVEVPAISKHIKNILADGELKEKRVISKMETTAADGKSYNTAFYNLDMIIAVGYRVNSRRATAFRIWATAVLREYIIKGYALDDDRLKNGNKFDKAYFRDLLERIKDIRTSERMLYQQLKDIYSLSADYNRDYEDTILFFAKVQNKVHFAITGQTAAEVIHSRADANMANMGLTTWQASPDGRITRQDVTIAKNYLKDPELKELRYIVNLFLDYAQHEAEGERVIYMRDWERELDKVLELNRKELLQSAGKISHEEALKKAIAEYEKYRVNLKLTEKEDSEQEYLLDIKELEKLEAELGKER